MHHRSRCAPPWVAPKSVALAIAISVAWGLCASGQQFEPPIPVVELNTARQEKSPCISANGLELWFQSNRTVGAAAEYWVYVARRTDTGLPFDAPERVVKDAANPDISHDGLTLYVAKEIASRGEGIDLDLFRLRRPSLDAEFGDPEPIDELNTSAKEGSPTLTADELIIFFHSDRPGTLGLTDLWMASRASEDQPFDPPVPVPGPGLNTLDQDQTPSISPDGLVLYFASNRPGGVGGLDIWATRRAARTEPFEEPRNVAEVNTDGTEKACDISSDGLTLYLRTKSPEGDTQSDIAVAYDARAGTVNRVSGTSSDVLFVNDRAGARSRVVTLAPGEPLTMRIEASPAGPAPARYALYAIDIVNRTPTVSPQPFSLGVAALSTPLDGGTPRPAVLINLFHGKHGKFFGTPRFVAPPAPATIFDTPGGIGHAGRWLIQGILEDSGSGAQVPLAITNAIELRVE